MRNTWVLLPLLLAGPARAVPDDARAEFAAALRCEARGLPDAAALHHARVLALEPDHLASRRALGFVRDGDGWTLPAHRRAAAARRLHADDAQARAAALATLGLLADGDARVRVFAVAAANPHADVRLAAVRALAGRSDTPVLKMLARRALADADDAVRAAAVDAIREARREHPARLLTPYLHAPDVAVRIRAVEALGALGDRGAVGPLIAHLSVAGGSTQRAYFAQTDQVAFVKDFDVEIA